MKISTELQAENSSPQLFGDWIKVIIVAGFPGEQCEKIHSLFNTIDQKCLNTKEGVIDFTGEEFYFIKLALSMSKVPLSHNSILTQINNKFNA